jgi:hypothetical protein
MEEKFNLKLFRLELKLWGKGERGCPKKAQDIGIIYFDKLSLEKGFIQESSLKVPLTKNPPCYHHSRFLNRTRK